MSHDFLAREICFISTKAEQENSRGLMTGSYFPFAVGRHVKRDVSQLSLLNKIFSSAPKLKQDYSTVSMYV